jgi:DinB superfamily
MRNDRWTSSGLQQQLQAVERDAQALVAGLTDANGEWRSQPGSWSVAECLDHLAAGNEIYLRAMRSAAEQAARRPQPRDRNIRPELLGRLMMWMLEPPARLKTRAPAKIRPRESPPLQDSFKRFIASHRDVLRFLQECAGIDIVKTRFPNPFIRGLRFSLAAGLYITAAHERRHLWQAWRVRSSAERAAR